MPPTAACPPAPAAPAAADPWLADPFPGRFTVPTMLTPEEVNYLHWLGRSFHSGAGRVVDLGCFFGGSTVALATGLKANPRARGPLLTYDSFVMDMTAEGMFLHPYRAGESFRPLFDVMTTRVRDAVVVREGWLPESVDQAGERALYPEQEPIEVLFVDVAKTWDVHLTVLKAFGRHLIPGRSLLVQQDFKHYYQFWIPIHMHQLRDCFRPVHDVPRSATLTFEYVGGLEEKLDSLMRPGKVTEAGAIEGVWDEIEAFWARRSLGTVMTVKLNRAMHLCHARWFQAAVAALESFAHWLPTSGPRDAANIGRAEAATASRIILHHADAFAKDIAPELKSCLDAVNARLSSSSARGASFGDAAWLRECLWRQATDRCRSLGAKRIALYGAGRHTRSLLDAGFPFDERIRVTAILDDTPPCAEVGGVPVSKPAEAPRSFDVVVVSSDQHEQAIALAARRAFPAGAVPIVRIYEPDGADLRSASSGMPASSSRRSPKSSEK